MKIRRIFEGTEVVSEWRTGDSKQGVSEEKRERERFQISGCTS